MNKKIIWIITITLVLIGVSMYFALNRQRSLPSQTITNFEECAKVYPVMESYPAKCRTPDGRLFIQVISDKTASPPVQLEMIINFEQCAKAGYPVTASYPGQCRTPEGKTFTEFTQ